MTTEEQRTRLEVASEILEMVMLDFLEHEENKALYFSTATVSKRLGFNYDICMGVLKGLHWQERIDNHKPTKNAPNRWQAKPQ